MAVLSAWLVHLFTACGALLGLYSLRSIQEGEIEMAFWLMATAVAIDAFDGMLARLAEVKKHAALIDGALLDNIIDFLNYVIVPAFLLLNTSLLPGGVQDFLVGALVLSSCYQFSQVHAKTADHFFLGFPCYWNIAVFYLFLMGLAPIVNAVILSLLIILVFVPIKYVYPSRPDGVSRGRLLPRITYGATLVWGACFCWLLLQYGEGGSSVPLWLSLLYMAGYVILSVFRTLVPAR